MPINVFREVLDEVKENPNFEGFDSVEREDGTYPSFTADEVRRALGSKQQALALLEEIGVPAVIIRSYSRPPSQRRQRFPIDRLPLECGLVCELMVQGYVLKIEQDGQSYMLDLPYPRGHRSYSGGPEMLG